MATNAASRSGALTTAGVNSLTAPTTQTLADHSAYSRKRLGDGIVGDYKRHCLSMELGSKALLEAIKRARA